VVALGWSREARATVALALPLIAGQLSIFGMNVAEVLLAGHLGAHVLGTVALGSALFNIANLAAAGVNAAVAPSVAQLDGARLRRETGPLFRQALAIASVLGVLLAALVAIGGPRAAAAFGFAPALAADVGGFLRAVAPAAFGLSLFYCCRGFSEGLSLTRPTMLFGLLGLAVLVPVGYALMYGALGLPALGARGAGFAYDIAIGAQTVGFALWLRFSGRYRGVGWRAGSRRLDGGAIAGLLRVGLPMAVSLVLETTLFSAAGLAIGLFGEVAESGHQIALNVAALSFMVPLGVAIATTVRVGNAVGRGDASGVRRAGACGMGLALLAQSASGATMLLAPGAIARLYSDDPAVIGAAVAFLRIAGVFQLSDGLQVAAIGALRGLKDTRMPMLITALAYWGIGFPVALLLSFRLGFGPVGMWYGLIAGLTVAAGLLTARFAALSRKLGRAWPA
jgi:MATE family multidrug resistance protein